MVIGRHDSPRRPLLRAPASEIHAIRPMQPCRAPSKSSPASRRLAGLRRSLRQLQAGLQGLVEVFASFKQACRDSSKSSPASSRLAGLRRSLRQPHAGLQGLVEVFASSKQACRVPIYRKSASSTLAWTRFTVNQLQAAGPRYTVYQLQARLHGFDIQYSNCLKANRYHTNKHK